MYLLTNVILNTIDILMLFLLSHACAKRIPIFTAKRVMIGIAYGITMGVGAQLLGDDYGYIYRSIAMPAAFLMIYLMVKLPFSSTFLIYILVWLFQAIQFPIILLLQFAQLDIIPMFLIGQIVTLIVVILSCKFLPLNKWYRFIEEYLELKMFFFLTTFAILSVFFYWDFEDSWLYIVYFGIILTATLAAIYCVGSKIVYSRYKMPLQSHNDYHINLGLMMKAYKEEDHQEIERLNKVNKDSSFKLQTENFHLGKLTENLIAFIENKRRLSDQDIEIQYDVDYDSDHPYVNLVTIVKMLSILLDNAIESGTDKPIIVELTSTASYIQLSVRNEFAPPDSEEMSRIFTIDGYTTKKTNQRGYGLTNLHYDVKKLGGKIMTGYDYSAIRKVQYLNITINI